MNRYKEKYNIKICILPELNNNKDVAEFVKQLGLEKTKNIINERIN